MSEQFNLPGVPVPPAPKKPICTQEAYKAEVEKQYGSSFTIRDALRNWTKFEAHRETCRKWVAHYLSDNYLEINGNAFNPGGTLKGMAWLMQGTVQPDKSRLDPFLDFEEHYQQCFLRRGLMIYLNLLLKEME